jgi:hypothetical protein
MSRTHPAATLPLKVVAAYGEEIVTGTAVARAARALGDELRARGSRSPPHRGHETHRVDTEDGEYYAHFLKQ